jgi:hypothetical protein
MELDRRFVPWRTLFSSHRLPRASPGKLHATKDLSNADNTTSRFLACKCYYNSRLSCEV